MRNPAAVFAVSIPGSSLEVWQDAQGGQTGIVVLPNGERVEEWALFRANMDNHGHTYDAKVQLQVPEAANLSGLTELGDQRQRDASSEDDDDASMFDGRVLARFRPPMVASSADHHDNDDDDSPRKYKY